VLGGDALEIARTRTSQGNGTLELSPKPASAPTNVGGGGGRELGEGLGEARFPRSVCRLDWRTGQSSLPGAGFFISRIR
jgi:hypothetical protein